MGVKTEFGHDALCVHIHPLGSGMDVLSSFDFYQNNDIRKFIVLIFTKDWRKPCSNSNNFEQNIRYGSAQQFLTSGHPLGYVTGSSSLVLAQPKDNVLAFFFLFPIPSLPSTPDCPKLKVLLTLLCASALSRSSPGFEAGSPLLIQNSQHAQSNPHGLAVKMLPSSTVIVVVNSISTLHSTSLNY